MNRFFQTSRPPGRCGLPFGIQAQPRGQQQHVGVGAEHRTRRTGAGDLAANRRVEALHALRLGQVILDRTVDARQRIVVAGQPAVVAAPSASRRTAAPLSGRRRRPARPTLSRCARRREPRLAVADLEHAAEEIQHVRVDLQALARESSLRSSSAVSGSSFDSPGTGGRAKDRTGSSR